jgi:phosphohistidine phosphatase
MSALAKPRRIKVIDVVLFRHGIAVEQGEWEGKEADRPLTDKGRKRTKQSAQGLTVAGLSITHMLASPLARARESADIVAAFLRPRVAVRICDELLPDAPPDKALSLLASLPPRSVVVCVGHEPHLGILAGHLLQGKAMQGLTFKKAGACLIHLEEGVRAGKGRLEWWLPPAMLRALR